MTTEQMIILCIIGCILVLVLKQYQRSYALLLSIGLCLLVIVRILPDAERILSTAEQTFHQFRVTAADFGILCKAVGISYLTQFGMDICRDAGENALGTAVELCGRVLLLMLALPLFVTLSETILEMMP